MSMDENLLQALQDKELGYFVTKNKQSTTLMTTSDSEHKSGSILAPGLILSNQNCFCVQG